MPVPTAQPPRPSSRRASLASSRARLRLFDGYAVGGEFLAEADGHRVLHVGAAGLDDAVELFGLFAEGGGQRIEHGIEGFKHQQRAERACRSGRRRWWTGRS